MNLNKKIFGALVVLILLAAVVVWANRDRLAPLALRPTESTLPTVNPGNTENNSPAEEVIAQGLKIPWEIVFLPDGSMLVTERPGSVVRITPSKVVIPVEGVAHVGEGGLLGMALHPDFRNNQRIYLYATTRVNGALRNRVESYRFANDSLSDRKVILENIPGSSNHDGGRIAFGPDGDLYITTGDAEQTQFAQDKNSLAGKILRVNDDGSIPSDNPFGNAVYSYGHRNPQGLAWDDQGRLWATEHGPSGSQTGHDELNRIEKGQNYGWPTIKGDQARDGMKTAVVNSGDDETWAPAGLAFAEGALYFGGLRGASLYVAKIKADGGVDLSAHLRGKYGRLRAAVMGPDGFLYITTSNTDGRGKATAGDDKIIRVKLNF